MLTLHVTLLGQACSVGGIGANLSIQRADTIVGLLRSGLTYVVGSGRILGMCNTVRAAFCFHEKAVPKRLHKRGREVGRVLRNKVWLSDCIVADKSCAFDLFISQGC